MRRFVVFAAALGILIAGCRSGPPKRDVVPAPAELEVLAVDRFSLGLPRDVLDEAVRIYTDKYPHVRIQLRIEQPPPLEVGQSIDEGVSDLFGNADVYIDSDVFMHGALADDLLEFPVLALPQLDPVISDLYKDLIEYDGRRFGLPLEFVPRHLLTHPDAEEFFGSLPPMDWTLNDWERLYNHVAPVPEARREHVGTYLEPVLAAFGGRLYDRDADVWTLDDEGAQQALAWLARQVRAGILTTEHHIGSQQEPYFRQSIQRPMSTRPILPFPRGPHGRGTTVTTTARGVILKGSLHGEQAAHFLHELIGNADIQLAFAEAGVRPLLNDRHAHAAWREAIGERHAEAIDLSLQGAQVELVPMNRRLMLMEELLPYFEGRIGLDEVVAQLQPKQGAGNSD